MKPRDVYYFFLIISILSILVFASTVYTLESTYSTYHDAYIVDSTKGLILPNSLFYTFVENGTCSSYSDNAIYSLVYGSNSNQSNIQILKAQFDNSLTKIVNESLLSTPLPFEQNSISFLPTPISNEKNTLFFTTNYISLAYSNNTFITIERMESSIFYFINSSGADMVNYFFVKFNSNSILANVSITQDLNIGNSNYNSLQIYNNSLFIFRTQSDMTNQSFFSTYILSKYSLLNLAFESSSVLSIYDFYNYNVGSTDISNMPINQLIIDNKGNLWLAPGVDPFGNSQQYIIVKSNLQSHSMIGTLFDNQSNPDNNFKFLELNVQSPSVGNQTEIISTTSETNDILLAISSNKVIDIVTNPAGIFLGLDITSFSNKPLPIATLVFSSSFFIIGVIVSIIYYKKPKNE